MRYLLILIILISTCDSSHPKTDAANDAGTDVDTVDIIDINDTVDIKDVHDAVDAEDSGDGGGPVTDPYQTLLSYWAYSYGAWYPYVFFAEMISATEDRIYVLDLQTMSVVHHYDTTFHVSKIQETPGKTQKTQTRNEAENEKEGGLRSVKIEVRNITPVGQIGYVRTIGVILS